MSKPMMSKERELWMAQRAIVLQVLRDDHAERWTRAELEREVSDLDPQVVGDALALLEAEGVVEGARLDVVWASQCLRHLDTLELVSV